MNDDFDVLIINSGINEDTLTFVHQEIKKQQSKQLYLIIETRGGSPEIGYRIMRLLDSKFDKIYIVIPDKAMSTGTLMALGGDKIYMLHSSSLGPLDLQIEHPTDGSWISTLDVRDTMNTIISHSEVAARRIFQQTYNRFGLSKVAAAKIANENAQKLIQPIVNKIDPYHLHKSFRSAAVGESYAAVLLKSRMMRGSHGVANSVSSILANDYSAHNYAITLDEAQKRLLLTADDLANLSVWPELEDYFLQTKKLVDYISNKAQTKSKSLPQKEAKPERSQDDTRIR